MSSPYPIPTRGEALSPEGHKWLFNSDNWQDVMDSLPQMDGLQAARKLAQDRNSMHRSNQDYDAMGLSVKRLFGMVMWNYHKLKRNSVSKTTEEPEVTIQEASVDEPNWRLIGDERIQTITVNMSLMEGWGSDVESIITAFIYEDTIWLKDEMYRNDIEKAFADLPIRIFHSQLGEQA